MIGNPAKRIITLCISLLLSMSIIGGCGNQSESATSADSSKETEKTTQKETEKKAEASEGKEDETKSDDSNSDSPEEISFPLFDTEQEMTVFWRLNPKATASMKEYGEMALTEELAKLANIRLSFIHAPSGQEGEKFNLLRVSGDYPDLIYWEQWLDPKTVGGPEKALNDDFIIPMNELISQYAPNYTKLLEDDSIRRAVSTDSGTLYGFSLLRYNQSMKSVWGQMIRMDWLEALDLEVPSTIEEYHDVLVAFRDQDPNGNGQKDEIPYTTFKDYIPAMFHPWGIVPNEFTNENGTAVYGPYTEAYRDALTVLSEWYAEGLIDPEFATNDQRQFEARLSLNISGACYGETGGSIGLVNKSFEEAGFTDHRIEGIPVFTADGGTGYNMAGDKLYNGVTLSISSKNEFPVESTKLFDWGYSEEGSLLWNFGVEGESYTLENGKPVFTDMITNNPDGLSIDQALARYCYGSMQGPFVFMPEVRDQRMLFYDWQRNSIDAWNNDDMSRIFPPATLSADESAQYAEIMTDIATYVEESRNQFINGSMPISEFDNYLSQLKSMGIEDAIALQQAALDRYFER